MYTRQFLPLLLLFLSSLHGRAQNTIELRNVNFFQDGRFQFFPTAFVVGGSFTFHKPAVIDTVFDLSGKFVLPPFAESHTHKVDMPSMVEAESQSFLNQGVFYVLVLNNFSSQVEANRGKLNQPTTVDVLYANGGITATGQHPFFAYERILSGIIQWWLPENTKKIEASRKGENDAYWFMDSPEEVEKKWEKYMSTKPDVVKVYLMNAKNYTVQTPKSLSEESLKKIVFKANKEKLRVVAHIETGDDLKMALHAGVSLFAHMPYYNSNFAKHLPEVLRFTKKERGLIKKAKAVIIPTLSFNEEFSIVRSEKNNYQGQLDTAGFQRALGFQKSMVTQLRSSGFRFAIGSDRDAFLPELLYWLENRFFSPGQTLTIATMETPKLLFPNRKFARLLEGYEASFLVLQENPLIHSRAVKTILLKVKQGRILQ